MICTTLSALTRQREGSCSSSGISLSHHQRFPARFFFRVLDVVRINILCVEDIQ